MPTNQEIDSQIMDLWDEIFDLEDKLREELENKYAEWKEIEPLLDKEGVEEVIIHMESIQGISEESMLIYKEVKIIKNRYKQEMNEKRAKIDSLKKEKK